MCFMDYLPPRILLPLGSTSPKLTFRNPSSVLQQNFSVPPSQSRCNDRPAVSEHRKTMGSDNTPEINIPMPEIPPPNSRYPDSGGLHSFFPFGPVVHMVFMTLDVIVDAKFWPSCPDDVEKELWHFFPYGPPVHMILTFVDMIYTLIRGV